MKVLKTILLAVELTDETAGLLDMAVHVAQRCDAEIIPIHIIPDSPGLSTPVDKQTVKEAAETEAERAMKALCGQLAGRGVRLGDSVISHGIPFHELISHSDKKRANLIMMGTGRRTPVRYGHIGITTQRVVRRSPTPVWVVKEGAKPRLERMICAVDFSPHSACALRNGIHLARLFNAELTVLTVVEKFYTGPGRLSANTQEVYYKDQEKRFANFLKDFDMHNVRVSRSICQGDAPGEIIGTARRLGVDLLLMGTSGRVEFSQVYTGSVTEKVLWDIPCSLLTLKCEDAIRLDFQAEVNDLASVLKRGVEILDNGFAEEAILQFREFLAKDPMSALGWEWLAQAHEHLGHTAEARQCHQRADHIRKNLARVRNGKRIPSYDTVPARKREHSQPVGARKGVVSRLQKWFGRLKGL